ncbi:MAG: transcription-repair coupling factor [Candidatus Muproteobacteria bacterium RIFCSPHIGHO2_02_FULL_65_16]|uniref:Transcription-repair-coupling factor n=1 Tax=Candidatus Muproteobacteria bacterium RIFCSPHIGHO2_02_FULL_65_16 TaxID=1817766 RepID=A0A1F6TTD5_9PROT|nr:MAG: transcription-repair coupling factor [Candidatus Muproteobacteria bacterium RIFCSPHIGHO2_02_FULL_65_16]
MQYRPAIIQKSLLNSPLKPVTPESNIAPLSWSRLYGSACGLAVAAAAESHPGPILVVARNAQSLRQLADEISFYLADSGIAVLQFPDWECLPYDVFSPHPDIVSQRLAVLHRLPALARGVVLTTAGALLQCLPPREYVAAHSFVLAAGDELNLEGLRRQLTQASYRSVSQVMEPGEFAVRGGLIDLFPVGGQVPYRVDLFGERVDTIREFDPQTQRSRAQLASVQLLPAREFPLNAAAIQQFRQAFRAHFEGDPQQVPLYRDISKGLSPAGVEYYLPLFFERVAFFLDYLPRSALYIQEEGVDQAARDFQREAEERYDWRRHDRDRPPLPPQELFLTAHQLGERSGSWPRITLIGFKADEAHADVSATGGIVAFDTLPPPLLPVNHKSDRPYGALLDYLGGFPGRVLIAAESPGRRETLRELLRENGLQAEDVGGWNDFVRSEARLGLALANLEKGLVLRDPGLAIVAEPQLYGERALQRRRRAARERDPEFLIRSLAEVRIGDPVVHEDHGVGRYLGLQTLDVGDGPDEFLALGYAGGDKLYLPVMALHRISRYTGTDPEHAPLHKLGGEAWDKAKRRALAKAHDAAVELLEIQALRAARRGHAFRAHDAQYQAFADAFPFEETPDQQRAIDEVLKDMEAGRPMDRLVCGDVGFGKTEVAMRAALLAAQDHKQVAVLAPTTLLALQHFQNFRDRFAGLSVRIELLSRFRARAEQALVLADLARGAVDIVIGTHRLLQGDVRFKDLGLVIIDEEHRFGVRHKERLKRLRSEVDILTLTATPIPRTLNMGLAGLRDISIIATAPEGRLSVKTLVSEWDRSLIREACLREIRRGGQVYYLHNEVHTIEKAARQLQELVPEAEIRIAHGQMPERELEHVMLDFYHQRFNVLVCSTIIESGIDVPSANTIVIERADKLGLAQLHQLRGRVGRSHHRAYAYLLIPGRQAITEDARKRLEAIESLEELGAGFMLAAHDLEIRGAGELLGEQQSGEIDEVGFALYSELLGRAVRSLQEGREPGREAPAAAEAEITLHAPALLPEDHVPDVHMRLVLYKRIAGAGDLQALQELREEIIDRFGPLPEPGQLLFQATELKILAGGFGIRKIDAGPKGVRVEFVERPDIEPGAILRLLQAAPRTYRLEGPNRLRIIGEMPDAAARIQAIRIFFGAMKSEKQ